MEYKSRALALIMSSYLTAETLAASLNQMSSSEHKPKWARTKKEADPDSDYNKEKFADYDDNLWLYLLLLVFIMAIVVIVCVCCHTQEPPKKEEMEEAKEEEKGMGEEAMENMMMSAP